MSDTEYDPSGNLNTSLHVGADILNLLLNRLSKKILCSKKVK